MSKIAVEPADPRAREARQLLAQSHSLMASLYADEDNHALDISALTAPDIRFLGATAQGHMIGCAALALRDGYGEIKSLFVAPEARGTGAAAALMQALEDIALAQGLPKLRLETGEELPAALALYERRGFRRCGAFGSYQDSPASVFMEKSLVQSQ
ncbi:GNAT family N-acetyltransferase [Cognatishimia sp. SS12]|uniref:GNAT family N-acetyltransferase n=1 Tax=Cognatishimia sp. SS12 TaxID=2979465 RepID=UPI00232E8A10|nr:GNAT family N-acetyltransferase [Cognatishimia sp. SS12]MDC0739252.1 GNAT family N-acetyltransferase [Cognatishimia sp. SS12]